MALNVRVNAATSSDARVGTGTVSENSPRATACEARARARQIDRLFLLTTTAAGYFEARGYVRVERQALPGPIRRSEEFTQLCPASAVAMASPVIAADPDPTRS